MGIYRGAGGTGDAVNDAASEAVLVNQLAIQAQTSANNAAASETAAANSATSASNSATASANSATSSANSATASANSATSASNSASSASTSATNASNSATAAQTAETNAETAETNAVASAELAQDWATKTSGPVAGGEYSSKYNAQQSASSASAAASSASAASTSATNASNSASAAATSATNAASSATAASGSATSASNSASAASTSASNAASSASSASGSASTATTQAGLAATSATNAANSASAASTSASSASTSASNASTSAGNAATSATASANSAATSEAARDAALAALDSFDDRYLGVKSSDPTLDNDGNALVSGALYFNSVGNVMKVYDGTQWLAAYASLAGALLASNNLSDLSNAVTARSNLGVAIGSQVQAWDGDLDAIATISGTSGLLKKTAANTWSLETGAYNNTNWDTAYGWGNHASAGYAVKSNNLSDLTSASTARTNLGLGTAATTASTDYATAAQGTKADSALQPATIGSSVQAWDADLDAIAAIAGTSGLLKKTAANTWSLDTNTYITQSFPSGTALLFQQTAAPTGWTKVTTNNNAALRVVSGTVGTGGTVDFTTAFASQAVSGTVGTTGSTTATGTVGATTLTTSQIPSHSHTFSGNTGTVSADHTHAVYGHTAGGGIFSLNNNYGTSYNDNTGNENTGSMSANHTHGFSGTTATAGTGGSHDHSFTGTAHTHTGGTFTGTAINLAVKYVDVIIATKD